jgi:hypothetical protein
MGRNDQTSAIIDQLLRLLATSTVLSAGLLAPNALRALEKPLNKYLNHLDGKARRRELHRVVSYMKSNGLLMGSYEHGLKITAQGRKRIETADFKNLTIPRPAQWDHTWRIVFYDIPEKHKNGRDHLTAKLRQLGMYQLQRSVWIHPFDCRDTIETVTGTFGLERYVSYIETPHLDNEQVIISRLKHHYPRTNFK